jgi:hypothetical protein
MRRLDQVEAELRSNYLRTTKRQHLTVKRESLKAYLDEAIKEFGRKSQRGESGGWDIKVAPRAGKKRTYKCLKFV